MTEEKKIKDKKAEKKEIKAEEDQKTKNTEIKKEDVPADDTPIEEVEVVKRNEIKKEEEIVKEKPKDGFDKQSWNPKTEIGKKIKNGEITDIDEILDNGKVILEPEIVESLLEGDTELLLIGQSKGKFGGGQRRIFKQTQKKTREGNKPKFATFAIYGNSNGYVGYGYGKAKETVPAREKAFRKSKLNIMKIRRGCGSWECGCGTQHSIPYKVQGKCSSVKITLLPAPKGTGLCIEPECQKILKLAGIKDVWSKTKGHTKTKLNLIYACIDALKNLASTKILPQHIEKLSLVEGKLEK